MTVIKGDTGMTAVNDKAAAARARLDEPKPEAWNFGEDGDEISGVVVRLEMADTQYGPCRILVIDPGDGKLRSVWLTHQALRGQVQKARPGPGDGIAIRKLGERESASGRTYQGYQVATDRDPVFSWDDSAGKPGRASSAPAGEVAPWDSEVNPFDDDPPF